MSQISSTKPTGDIINYRPISILALVGLIVSVLYGLFVFLFGLSSFVYGNVFLMDSWHYIVPLASVVISWLALRQIRNSEGTMAGASLAKWGIWIGVLTALGYGAYHLATSVALRVQSYSFLMTKDASGRNSGFLPLIMEGKDIRAFLLTQPSYRRNKYDPDEPVKIRNVMDLPSPMDPRGPIMQFETNEIVRALHLAAKEGKEPQSLGVQNWSFEGGSFLVEQSFRIPTSEVNLDVTIPVVSVDSKELGRTWFVLWKNVNRLDSTERTQKGEIVQAFRLNSYNWLQSWAQSVNTGRKTPGLTDAHNKISWATVDFPGIPKDRETLHRKQIREQTEAVFLEEAAKDHPITVIFPKLNPWQRVDDKYLVMEQDIASPVLRTNGKWTYTVFGTVRLKYREEVPDLTAVKKMSVDENAWEILSFDIKAIREMPAEFQDSGRFSKL